MRGGSKSPMNLSLLVVDLVDQSPLSTLPNPSSLKKKNKTLSGRSKVSSLFLGRELWLPLGAG
jgi:hypothetical protein